MYRDSPKDFPHRGILSPAGYYLDAAYVTKTNQLLSDHHVSILSFLQDSQKGDTSSHDLSNLESACIHGYWPIKQRALRKKDQRNSVDKH
jgi:hypothetical protein